MGANHLMMEEPIQSTTEWVQVEVPKASVLLHLQTFDNHKTWRCAHPECQCGPGSHGTVDSTYPLAAFKHWYEWHSRADRSCRGHDLSPWRGASSIDYAATEPAWVTVPGLDIKLLLRWPLCVSGQLRQVLPRKYICAMPGCTGGPGSQGIIDDSGSCLEAKALWHFIDYHPEAYENSTRMGAGRWCGGEEAKAALRPSFALRPAKKPRTNDPQKTGIEVQATDQRTADNVRLQEQHDKLKENHDLRSKNHTLLKENHTLLKENHDLFNDNHTLLKENHDLRSKIQDLRKENHDLRMQTRSAESCIATQLHDLVDAKTKLAAVEGKLEASQRENTEKDRQIQEETNGYGYVDWKIFDEQKKAINNDRAEAECVMCLEVECERRPECIAYEKQQQRAQKKPPAN